MEQQAAAFQELLGLEALPQSGRQAREASRQLCDLALAGVAPSPLLGQLVAEHLTSCPQQRPRFVDANTGLRLRYLEWGNGGDVVLLLHDLGESADIWAPIGRQLGQRGYHVFALDLRGHGESGRSRDGLYSANMLAEDVRAFILAKDLYVAPLALVGCGMGAAAALALVQQNPFLAGALVLAEFALPVAQLQARQARRADGGGSSGSKGAWWQSTGHGAGAASKQAGLWPAVVEVHATLSDAADADTNSSKQLMPWWGFRAGQAATFASVEHCAACLAHPMANLPPRLFVPLAQAAQRALAAVSSKAGAIPVASNEGSSSGSGNGDDTPAGTEEEAAQIIQQLLAQAQRPLRGAVASACSLLRLPPGLLNGDYWDGFDDGAGSGRLEPRTDPSFLFSFDAAALLAGMPNVRGHLLLLHGGSGASWVEAADADAMAELAATGGAASAAAQELPGVGHCLAADQPELLLNQLVAFLGGPAIRCFDKRTLMTPCGTDAASTLGRCPATAVGEVEAAGSRRPEVLGLRPLPQYASLEEAKKALGPRSIPSAGTVEQELRKLRVEEGQAPDGTSSDEEDGRLGRHRTALAKEPADYFGFVG